MQALNTAPCPSGSMRLIDPPHGGDPMGRAASGTAASAATAATAIDPLLVAVDRHPLRERVIGWLGIALSIAILAAVVSQLRGFDLAGMVALAPRSPLFWLVFLAWYPVSPLFEWLIYRRIWSLPRAGIVPLLRKLVSNEIVLGYSGDAHFYLWARRHAGITGSPFGAVKDVAMLSAVAGNLSTLAMMLAMAPVLAVFMTGALARTFAVSIAVVVVTSLTLFLFRRTLFSLPRRDLQMIFAVHMARIGTNLVLTAALWHLLLPDVSLGWWMALATLRMMLSRLPLLPNKDVLFAGLAILLLGRDAQITAVMAFMASLTLATHLLVGAITGAAALAEGRGRPRRRASYPAPQSAAGTMISPSR